MATAAVLQKPTITQIIGSTIRIAHPDISGNITTYLASQALTAAESLTVHDNDGLANSDWLLVGVPGDSQSETTDVDQAITRGQTVAVTNHLAMDHELQAQITKINERGITIYGINGTSGVGTIIESIDALTATGRQIADAAMIQWDKPYTEYTLITTDTTYTHYYATFKDGITESTTSDFVASTGLTSSSVQYFIDQALRLTNSKMNEDINRIDLVRWANDCQSAITQYMFRDPRSGDFRQMDWDFEVKSDILTIALTENENEYDLSSLSLKYPDSDKSIITARIGDREPLDKMAVGDFDDFMAFKRRTEVATQAEIGDTSLVVDSNVEFDDSGSLYLGSDIVTYTGKTGTTTFTGIPASGTGSITAQRVVDIPVWQNIAPGLPKKYTMFQGEMLLEKPVDNLYVGYILKLRFFKALTALTESSDTTEVNFTNAFQYYLAGMIETRKQNFDRADRHMAQFDKIVLANALKNNVPVADELTYYRYDNFLDPYRKDLDTKRSL